MAESAAPAGAPRDVPPLDEGTVLHADLDSFFASVEQRDHPELRGRPVIVGGGVVMAASYEARAHGVRGAMGGREARRLCPDAVVVPPRMDAYLQASRDVFAVFGDTTPLVEGVSVDEAFLEVGGLRRIRGAPSTIAQRLRDDVRTRVGLPISVGVARTKHLAKVASGLAKPDGLLVVPLSQEQRFLLSLPVERLWGVGPVTAAALHAARLRLVGDVASLTERELAGLVGGAAARHLHALASGRDPRLVAGGFASPGPRRRSMGAQHALGRGPHDPADVDAVLLTLVDRVTRRMRSADRRGSTVTVGLRFDDFSRSTVSHTLARPTAHTWTVLETARTLLRRRADEVEARGLTLVSVAVGGLDDHAAQLTLPLDATDGPELDEAVDAIRDKFGRGAVRRAVQLDRSERPEMIHLGE
ncbi:MAG: DNA polymerase IV [Aeromicrobium erythreum]